MAKVVSRLTAVTVIVVVALTKRVFILEGLNAAAEKTSNEVTNKVNILITNQAKLSKFTHFLETARNSGGYHN